MRRSPFVITATAAGLIGVLTFQIRRPTPITSRPTLSQMPATSSSTVGRPRDNHGTTTAPTTAPHASRRDATGKVVQYGYGALSVEVTVSGTKITDVTVVGLQTAEQYSQQLAQQVIPTLRAEVLTAQSAHISAVSGATYTSQAYATSLQSALDGLHT